MRVLSLVLALAAVIASYLALQRVADLEARSGNAVTAPEEHYEVAVVMGRMQHYHQKWWAAGQAGNAELAGFYLHELEEAMEEVAHANVHDEGVDVSKAMRTFGLPAVEELERLLNEEDVQAMYAKGMIMTNSCNGCHQSTGHAFIRIQMPTDVRFPDQDFQP